MSIQRNVQQQNALTFETMLTCAKHIRVHGLAAGIRNFFALQGIEIDRCAIVWACSEKYMLGYEFGMRGMLVTPERKFFSFELELDSLQAEVTVVHEFADASAEQNTSAQNRGTGKGQGVSAIAVLEAINRE